MKAAYLVKYGTPQEAFEIRELAKPEPEQNQILIRVEAFGLNFADVMARLGLYKDAPPLPAVLGYDVVGYVEKCGANVKAINAGDRVTALTRFGGYAEYAIAEKDVVSKIPEALPVGEAVALATQYTTAYFLANNMANLQLNDKILIHGAAGGVGTALVQLAIYRKCIVFGSCSSSSKLEYLRNCGVHHPINYVEEDFGIAVKNVLGDEGLDAVFDPVGGKSVKKGYGLLAPGGRLFSYGVSSINSAKSIFGKLKVLVQFGIYHPVQLLSSSRGIIGINMLKIAEKKPGKIAAAMKEVLRLHNEGILNPHVGATYSVDQLAQAHQFLESRKSMGKIVVKW